MNVTTRAKTTTKSKSTEENRKIHVLNVTEVKHVTFSISFNNKRCVYLMMIKCFYA